MHPKCNINFLQPLHFYIAARLIACNCVHCFTLFKPAKAARKFSSRFALWGNLKLFEKIC